MSNTENQFTITFWGVRGSIACPGPETVKYGGNTPCVEMCVGGTRLIFDGEREFEFWGSRCCRRCL
jgi:phosphoribosyl 1,2-cyclic phosphodiesterase